MLFEAFGDISIADDDSNHEIKSSSSSFCSSSYTAFDNRSGWFLEADEVCSICIIYRLQLR